jgi:error-prone DNA polymerase
MLSAVEDCVEQIARVRGEPIDLSRIPLDDPDVYAEIQNADTIGVFQIESRAQMQSCCARGRRTSTTSRPGRARAAGADPGQGRAPVHRAAPALREDPSYVVPPVEHPLLAEPLRDTLGVDRLPGPGARGRDGARRLQRGEAEGLRRAMSRKRSSEAAIEAFRERFVEGALGKGVDEETASEIYDKLVGFSGFGFPKSHAAAFGLLAYQSAWLRTTIRPSSSARS